MSECVNAVRGVKRRCPSILSAPSRSSSLARLLCPLELKIGRGLQALSRPAAGENLVIVTQLHTLSPPQHVVPLMKGTPTWLERWALYSCGWSLGEVKLVSPRLKLLEIFIKCIVTLSHKFHSFAFPLNLPDSRASARFSWMEWNPPNRSRWPTILQTAGVMLTNNSKLSTVQFVRWLYVYMYMCILFPLIFALLCFSFSWCFLRTGVTTVPVSNQLTFYL